MSKRTVEEVIDQIEIALGGKQPELQSIVESIGWTAPEVKNLAWERLADAMIYMEARGTIPIEKVDTVKNIFAGRTHKAPIEKVP